MWCGLCRAAGWGCCGQRHPQGDGAKEGACPAPTPAWDAVRSKEQGQGKPSLQRVLPHVVPFVLCLQPTGRVESGDSQLLPSPRCRPESDAERLGLAPVTPVGTWGSRAAGAEGASRTLESPALVLDANLGGCCRVFLVSPSIHLPHERGGGTSGSHQGRLEGKGDEGDQNLHLGIGLWCGCSWGSDPAA